MSQTFRNKEALGMEQHPEVPHKGRGRKEMLPSQSMVPSFQIIFIAGGTAGLKGCCSLFPDGTEASLCGVGYAGHGIPCSPLPSSSNTFQHMENESMPWDCIFNWGWEKLRHSAALGKSHTYTSGDKHLKLLPARGHCSPGWSGWHVPS